jgi:hypothetical protein
MAQKRSAFARVHPRPEKYVAVFMNHNAEVVESGCRLPSGRLNEVLHICSESVNEVKKLYRRTRRPGEHDTRLQHAEVFPAAAAVGTGTLSDHPRRWPRIANDETIDTPAIKKNKGMNQ